MASKEDISTMHNTDDDTSKDSSPIWTLVKFTIAMAILPMLSYFVVKRLFHDNFTLGALAAAIMVQIIIGFYIYKAINDDKPDPPQPPPRKKHQ